MFNLSFGRRLRLRRLAHHDQGRLLIVPLDHSVTDGPVTGGRRVNRLLGQISAGGADAVVLHKGVLRYADPAWFDQMSLMVHLSASTFRAPDPDHKYLVGTAEEALRLGADAVSVHVNLGAVEEARQVADMAAIARECDALNLPLMAMVYPRGVKARPDEVDAVRHAVVLATDLGVDVVKTVYPGSPAAMAQVTESTPLPVVVAGGKAKGIDDLRAHVLGALAGGAAGVAVGRAVFEAGNPFEVVTSLSQWIHHVQPTEASRLEIVQ